MPVRGLGVSFLFRRAGASWLLLACITVTVLLSTGVAAVLWTFSDTVVPGGALSALAGPQGRVIRLSGVVDAGQAAADSQLIRATLRKAWPGVSFQMESALWSDPLQLSSTGTATMSAPGVMNIPTITQIQPASVGEISAQATLTAGRWPGAPHHSGPLPAALPVAVASQLHLTVGSELTGTPQPSGAPTTLQVTGLFQPRNPASPYWNVDLLPVSGISSGAYSLNTPMESATGITVSYGPAVMNPAALGGALGVSEASWSVLPQAAAMAHGNITALAANTSDAFSQLTVALPEGLKVTSNLSLIHI